MIVAYYDKVLDLEGADDWDLIADVASEEAAGVPDPYGDGEQGDFVASACYVNTLAVVRMNSSGFRRDKVLPIEHARGEKAVETVLDDTDALFGYKERLPSSWAWKRPTEESVKSVFGGALLAWANEEAKKEPGGENWGPPLSDLLGEFETFVDPAVQAHADEPIFYPLIEVELAFAIAYRIRGNKTAIRAYFICVNEREAKSGLSPLARNVKKYFSDLDDKFSAEREEANENGFKALALFSELQANKDAAGDHSDSARVAELEEELTMARGKLQELEVRLEMANAIPKAVGFLPRLVFQLAREGKTRKEILDVLLSEKYSRCSRKSNYSKENGVSLAIAGALLSPCQVWNYTNQAQKIRDGLSLDEPDERGN